MHISALCVKLVLNSTGNVMLLTCVSITNNCTDVTLQVQAFGGIWLLCT